MNKSKLLLKNAIDFKKEITINELRADKQSVEFHKNKLKETFGHKISDEEIEKRIHMMVTRDNVFNAIMEYIVSCFDFEINQEQLKETIERITKLFPEAPKDMIEKISSNEIIKNLIFHYLQNEWKIVISDEEIQKLISVYVDNAMEVIRAKNSSLSKDELENKIEEEKIKVIDHFSKQETINSLNKTILEEKTANEIINKFHQSIKFNLQQTNTKEKKSQ